MTRKLKRTSDFELSLILRRDGFIRPPREAQRTWILNQALKEFSDDLNHLDILARAFVPGTESPGIEDRTQGGLTDEQIMEDWQIPIMRAMADAVAAPGKRVLEIGFGRGVASGFVQERTPASHTIIECNDSVVTRFHDWRKQFSERDIRLIHAKWQDAMDKAGQFDGILFHTYPLNNDEFVEQIANSVTFAEHFFATAANHLEPDGAFTYLTNEIDSLSRAHQRALFHHFRAVELSVVRGLQVPTETKDAMWGDSMVVVKAIL